MRSARHVSLTCVVLAFGPTFFGFVRTGFAQDAPGELPVMPSEPPPAAPPSPASPEEPPSNLSPTDDVAAPAPQPGPAAPAPVLSAAQTGNAAYAPLPQDPPNKQTSKPSAAPPRSAPPAQDSAPASDADIHHQQEADQNDHSSGLFGPFRIGALVGGGLPEILSFGGQIKVTRFVGLGINVGLIPTVKISYYGDAKLSYQEYDAYGRLYPFGGAFFLGAGVGYANIKGTLNSRISTGNLPQELSSYGVPNPILVDSQGSVRTLVLTPQIGFLKVFDSGFAIGLDVGAQLPIAPSKVEFATNTPNLRDPAKTYVQSTYIKPNDDKVRSTLDTIGRTPLPTFGLKIGWFL